MNGDCSQNLVDQTHFQAKMSKETKKETMQQSSSSSSSKDSKNNSSSNSGGSSGGSGSGGSSGKRKVGLIVSNNVNNSSKMESEGKSDGHASGPNASQRSGVVEEQFEEKTEKKKAKKCTDRRKMIRPLTANLRRLLSMCPGPELWSEDMRENAEKLLREGYCIFPGVLSSEDVQILLDGGDLPTDSSDHGANASTEEKPESQQCSTSKGTCSASTQFVKVGANGNDEATGDVGMAGEMGEDTTNNESICGPSSRDSGIIDSGPSEQASMQQLPMQRLHNNACVDSQVETTSMTAPIGQRLQENGVPSRSNGTESKLLSSHIADNTCTASRDKEAVNIEVGPRTEVKLETIAPPRRHLRNRNASQSWQGARKSIEALIKRGEDGSATVVRAPLASRESGRYDMPLPNEIRKFMEKKVEAKGLLSFVRALCKNGKLRTQDILLSEPGSTCQQVHTDSTWIGKANRDPMPGYYTILIPLTDQNEVTGGTRIWPGTHRSYKSYADYVGEPIDALNPMLNVGDALVFDGLLSHCGMANNSHLHSPISRYFYYAAFSKSHDPNTDVTGM